MYLATCRGSSAACHLSVSLCELARRARGRPSASREPGHVVRCETIPGVNTQTADSVFIRACRRQPVSTVPVWYMRQAGRSLPEYLATRAGTAMLDACTQPALITEITLQPVRRYGVDAAILFSDIILPLRAAGLDIDIRPGMGPVLDQPFRDEADVAGLPELEPDEVAYIGQAVRMLTA